MLFTGEVNGLSTGLQWFQTTDFPVEFIGPCRTRITDIDRKHVGYGLIIWLMILPVVSIHICCRSSNTSGCCWMLCNTIEQPPPPPNSCSAEQRIGPQKDVQLEVLYSALRFSRKNDVIADVDYNWWLCGYTRTCMKCVQQNNYDTGSMLWICRA